MSHDINTPFQGKILMPLQKYFQAPPTKSLNKGSSKSMMVKLDRGLFAKNLLIGSFEISRFATTKKEWRRVFWWAIENGYKFSRGKAMSEEDPITDVSMYDCLVWCNAKSEMEKLEPCYIYGDDLLRQNDATNDRFAESVIDLDRISNGYRIPYIWEWIWAAMSGNTTQEFRYAGSDNPESVAWFGKNSEGHSMPVGRKLPNEIGIYDMSGNVWEWVWCEGALVLPCMGGSWKSDADECEINTFSEYNPPPYYASDEIGFRYVRSLDFFNNTTLDIRDLTEDDVQYIIRSIENPK